ncbi:MAG: TonB-dependent receptor plug domain-containing protein [Burkholderiales bacterium]|nr:TonB-dependent receptor plug domain-containing protein [Burkholderiales bacterium]
MTNTTPVLGRRRTLRGALIGATILAGLNALPAGARAQEAAANPPVKTTPAQVAAGAEEPSTVEAVVVTGYRQSLENSANAKKNTTNFIDSIFAEDIGKFPDLNLTESLQRLPGVQIDRDTSGEGTYINVRGLSAGFTVLTVNGFAISTSANGFNEGRGSSLDILPSELFRRLTLSKSPVASTVEGGTAGSVDMQPVHAFDRKGFHLNLQAQGSYQDVNKTATPRVAGIVSNTWEGTRIGDFGILLAGAYAQKDYRSEIFNTVGYRRRRPASPASSATPGKAPGSATSASCWRGPTPRRTIAARSSTRSATPP